MHPVKQDFLRRRQKEVSCAAAEVSYGEPTERRHLGPCTPMVSRRTAKSKPLYRGKLLRGPTEPRLHVVARNFREDQRRADGTLQQKFLR